MCGICGVIDFSESPDAAAVVRRMTPTMLHRGPDDEGYLDRGRISLGMRRLSIIDLEGGHQPIYNEDGSVGVVLNGEIYNFRELGKRLEDRGHRLSTRSDSEIVAHAYEEWGPACLDHFQGMFAIAIYDRRLVSKGDSPRKENGTLFLARDRFGIKPLYYYQDEHRLLFASEVRTLLASGAVPRRLSRSALRSYLLFGSVSEPMTLVEGVLSLPPGHTMTLQLRLRTRLAEPRSYWNIARNGMFKSEKGRHGEGETRGRGDAENVASNGHPSKSDSDSASHQVRDLLEQSVRRHLIADVPVGVFLSSGIDSTSLAALASQEVSGVHTFTVAFPEKEFSEAAIARRTAQKFGTTHEELMLTSDEMLTRLSEAVGALDQPSIDGINTYFVSWGARQAGLKVALSGLGGDEVFGGYNTFRRTPQYQRIASIGSRVPGALRSAMAAAVAGAGEGTTHGDAARKIAALWNDPEALPHPYFFCRALFTPPQVGELMKGPQSAGSDHLWWNWLAEAAGQSSNLDGFTAVSCMEARSYLVSTLLRDTDSTSMAHSLEVRVPFLDHTLVEYVIQLSEATKLRKGTPKALLVSALEDLLPAEVVNQEKRGFTFPWESWLGGPLRQDIDKGLSELAPALRETINPKKAAGVWQSYLAGHTSWSRPWSLYVLNEWTRRHLG
ncbi:MAG: asparagine synthase (glutamine-hydrolyzing) [Pyrinomonadaceae bacterium]|nr:asparagine synthase (glutamine-hydrolyzing) [Pyrinomonadaceae bacterium]